MPRRAGPASRPRPGLFDELVVTFVASLRSANTQAAYGADLAAFRTWCASRRVDPVRVAAVDIESFRRACEAAGSSRATVARRVSALRSFFGHAVLAGVIERSPVDGVAGASPAPPSPPGVATVADEDRSRRSPSSARPTGAPAAGPEAGPAGFGPRESAAVLAASRGMGGKAEVLVALLLVDGVKLGEVLAADVADLDAARRTLAIEHRRHATSRRLHPVTTRAIIRYLADRRHGPLLLGDSPTRPTARLTRFGADYLIKRTSEQAGLTSAVSANTLRRSHIGAAHAGGESIEEIRVRVGHLDARTTRRHLA